MFSGQDYRYKGAVVRFKRTIEDIKEGKLNDVDLTGLVLSLYKLQLLCNALKENYAVKTLNLTHCKIGDEGAAYLAEFLTSERHIQTLILADNNLTGTGFKVLCDALVDPETFNKRQTGIAIIHSEAEFLKLERYHWDEDLPFNQKSCGNTAVKHLDVSSNNIKGTEALTAMRKLMVGNQTLETINLNFNPFDLLTRAEIRNTFAYTETLQRLDTVSSTDAYYEGENAIALQNEIERSSIIVRAPKLELKRKLEVLSMDEMDVDAKAAASYRRR